MELHIPALNREDVATVRRVVLHRYVLPGLPGRILRRALCVKLCRDGQRERGCVSSRYCLQPGRIGGVLGAVSLVADTTDRQHRQRTAELAGFRHTGTFHFDRDCVVIAEMQLLEELRQL